MGYCVPVYLRNSGTHNFFETTTFGTRHIFVARNGSYKSTPSMALIRASNAAILFWSMPLDDLVLWDSLVNGSMTTGAAGGGIECTNAGLYGGSWSCSLNVSSGWAVAGGWTKIAGRLEEPSPEVFLNVCSSKLERRATLAFRDSNSSWKWASWWARSSSSMFLARSQVL